MSSAATKRIRILTYFGGLAGQGRPTRNDFITVTETLLEGSTMFEIADNYPVQFIHYSKRDFRTRVTVLVGPPWIGKS